MKTVIPMIFRVGTAGYLNNLRSNDEYWTYMTVGNEFYGKEPTANASCKLIEDGDANTFKH